MLIAFIQIDTKELFRGVFNVAWSFIWAFKWYIAILLGIVLIEALLKRLLEIEKFRKYTIIFLISVLVAFFIWLYS